jgi:hypothetical protein
MQSVSTKNPFSIHFFCKLAKCQQRGSEMAKLKRKLESWQKALTHTEKKNISYTLNKTCKNI